MAEAGDRRQDLDVAIVGAGVSGVYAGWRLLAAGKAKSVTIFEQSERIGGRLLSLEPPGMPGVFCELGGMRFTSNQPLVVGLIKELELATHPFPVEEGENINYLRGTHVRQQEFGDPTKKLPYDLDWAEQGMNPDDLLAYAVEQVIPGATQMSTAPLRKFLERYKLDGRHVYDWGFWNLLARGLSHEGYELARASGGYDTPLLNWNALDTISLNFDLAAGVTYSAVDGGYQSVPLTVAEKFEKLGGKIELSQHLDSFDVDADGKVVLHLSDPDAHAKHEEVRAGALVLAMPRRSLELISPTGPVLDRSVPGVRDLIESVTPIPLFKLCIAYPYPWWESVGVTQGRSQTDLPIRQCYYWATGRPHGGNPDNRKSVLLATYDDGLNVDFWNGYSNPKHHPPFETVEEDELVAAHPASELWNKYKPTAPMIAEADRQLREMHGVRVAPKPYAAAYIDWGVDPYGGGVNFWNIHARSSQVIPSMTNPVPAVPVYVCGEAYSNGQGWVEGALETAEIVLQEHFGLSAPDWAS
ncbi:MAG TPA: NAD(P)/FAD-dependent oxidoreductase [Solirubrobacteraceae bacterium]|nr:NAD(P)/FAD-dependent oxidoreductase [Solirubrobacteraceae bacterium]